MGHCKCILYVYPIYLCTSIYDTMCTCVSVGVPPLAVYKHGPGQSLSNGTLSLCPMGNTYTNHRPRRPDRETAHRGHSASPPIQSNNNSNNNNIRRTRTAVAKSQPARRPTRRPTQEIHCFRAGAMYSWEGVSATAPSVATATFPLPKVF